jgi:cbb3-type cytochrome c oxidase subunit III
MTTHHEHESGTSPGGRAGRGITTGRRRAGLALLVVATLGAAAGAPRVGPAVRAAGAAPGDTITPAMIALGERIFQGKAGGALCATCHGKDAKGVQGIGPNLTDGAWLHGDGSLEFLRTVIRTGVAKPKAGGAMMPPFGGTPLSAEQLDAVAAYVYSLSHPSAR